ncbi:MAG: hypothetical protein COY40_03215 [Alphaproteobacteria bacterium CG_4_10_14_0_8_um_filter_53_9]|nr:MAG: hypothetical protein COY40_03215 [Alphaproteobacteria bacterium CG_4_10_14_0_8_um_filter_53_9]
MVNTILNSISLPGWVFLGAILVVLVLIIRKYHHNTLVDELENARKKGKVQYRTTPKIEENGKDKTSLLIHGVKSGQSIYRASVHGNKPGHAETFLNEAALKEAGLLLFLASKPKQRKRALLHILKG